MYQDKKNGTSVKLILDNRVKTKRGLYPVKVQVISNRKVRLYQTGKQMSEDDWGRLAISRLPAMAKMRKDLKDSFDLIMKYVDDLEARGMFSFEKLKMLIGRTSVGTLNSALKVKIEELHLDSQIGTMNYYQGILADIERYAGGSLEMRSISVEWLRRYERNMLDNDLSVTTIAMRMRGIRHIMNRALSEDNIKQAQYPFGKGRYEIQVEESVKKALSVEQVTAISNYSDGTVETEKYRDLWLFIYMCNGLNIADLVNLKYSNIVEGEILFIREKTKRTSHTKKTIRAVLMPEMECIIKKWGNSPHPESYIFSLISHSENAIIHAREVKQITHCINKRMNRVGEALGIGRITTYTARHTFATTLLRNNVNVTYISESLGHSDLKTTSAYLASFGAKDRHKFATVLTKFNQ